MPISPQSRFDSFRPLNGNNTIKAKAHYASKILLPADSVLFCFCAFVLGVMKRYSKQMFLLILLPPLKCHTP